MAKEQATPTGPAVVTIGNPGASMPSTPNKSVPAPPVAVPASVKKWLWRAMVVAVIAGTIALIASLVHKSEQKQSSKTAISEQTSIPLASAPLAAWTKLTLPPKVGGRVDIPVHPGYRPMISGDSKFVVHTVYSDKHECTRASEGEGSDTVCPTGAVEVYVTNKMAKENPIAFAYDPI